MDWESQPALPAPDAIQRELSSGEKLLWWSQPQQGLMFRSTDVFTIPFSLVWCGFAIFWETMVFRTRHVPVFFLLWGLPFVALGLYLVVGRFFVEARQRKHTYYGLTQRRVVIVSGIASRHTKSLNLRGLALISLVEKASAHTGSIIFGSAPAAGYRVPPGWPSFGNREEVPQFDRIDDARKIYDLIRATQDTLRLSE